MTQEHATEAPEFHLVPITADGIAQLKQYGLHYPSTPWQVRNLIRYRERNGFGGAFIRIGHRWFIDVEAFIRILRERKRV